MDPKIELQPPIWTSQHSKISIGYMLFLLVGVLAVYNIRTVHPAWFLFITTVVIWYFIALSNYNKKWSPLTEKIFAKKLFWHSLLYRILASVFLIVIAQITWGRPDYVGAQDAITYHKEAVIISGLLKNLEWNKAFITAVSFTGSIDNAGPSLFIGAVFAVFGNSYIWGSLVYCVINAFGVVFLYKTARIIWGEAVGKTTGIMFMHFPLSLFFSTVFMKEGVVVVLLLYIVYVTSKSINGKGISIINLFFLIAAIVSLFFFRTVVGALMVVLVATAFLINRYQRSRVKSILLALIALGVVIYSIYATGESQFLLNRLETRGALETEHRTEALLESGRLFGYSLLEIITSPLYFVLAIVAPFPAMISVSTYHGLSHDSNWYFMPGLLIWNILAFFSIIGFYYSVKEKLFSSFMVWAFTGGYLYILTITVFFTRVRFAYLGMPLMLALAAVGIMHTKKKTHWIIYLAVAGIATIIWNSLRLSVRG